MAVIPSEFSFTPVEINGLVNFQKCMTDFTVHLGFTGPVPALTSQLLLKRSLADFSETTAM